MGAALGAYCVWQEPYLLAVLLVASGVALPLHRFSAERQRSLPTAAPATPTAMPMTTQEAAPVLQPAALDDLEAAGYGKAFLQEIAEGFDRDGRALLSAMDQIMQTGASNQFRDLAHTLKGNAVSVGAQRLAQVCQQAEQLAPHPDEQRHTLDALHREFAEATQAISDYLRLGTASH